MPFITIRQADTEQCGITFPDQQRRYNDKRNAAPHCRKHSAVRGGRYRSIWVLRIFQRDLVSFAEIANFFFCHTKEITNLRYGTSSLKGL